MKQRQPSANFFLQVWSWNMSSFIIVFLWLPKRAFSFTFSQNYDWSEYSSRLIESFYQKEDKVKKYSLDMAQPGHLAGSCLTTTPLQMIWC